jgi:hypothetical protein
MHNRYSGSGGGYSGSSGYIGNRCRTTHDGHRTKQDNTVYGINEKKKNQFVKK